MQEAAFANEKKMQVLQSQLTAAKAEKTIAVNEIKHTFEKERDSLSYLLEKTREKNEYDKKLAVSNATTELKEGYEKIIEILTLKKISNLYKTSQDRIKIFFIPRLQIVKITLPRPAPQGSSLDRDLHGASYSIIIEELSIR